MTESGFPAEDNKVHKFSKYMYPLDDSIYILPFPTSNLRIYDITNHPPIWSQVLLKLSSKQIVPGLIVMFCII